MKKILKEEKIPPNILYHGTARSCLEPIVKSGLLPQRRQYVHLSQGIQTAKSVGCRHDDKPCMLIIAAKGAWDAGIKFYFGNDKVWLADVIPTKYLKKL